MVRSKKKTKAFDDVFEDLSGANRRRRQEASHTVATLAHTSPDLLLQHVDSLIDALYRPEAQTRWEILNALSVLAPIDAKAVADAFDGAEASLFDDISGKVRLAAFQFLAIHGSTSEPRSNKAWPLLDEAIQCYHGDIEYHSMLVVLTTFASGAISKKVGTALVKRMSFDAKNGFGYVQSMSAKIIDLVQSKHTSNSSAKKSSSRSSQSSEKNKAGKGEKAEEQSQEEKPAEKKAKTAKPAVKKEKATEPATKPAKTAKPAAKTAKPAKPTKPATEPATKPAKPAAKPTKPATEPAKPAAKKASCTTSATKKASTVNAAAKETNSRKNAESKKETAAKSTSRNAAAKKQPAKKNVAKKSRSAARVAK